MIGISIRSTPILNIFTVFGQRFIIGAWRVKPSGGRQVRALKSHVLEHAPTSSSCWGRVYDRLVESIAPRVRQAHGCCRFRPGQFPAERRRTPRGRTGRLASGERRRGVASVACRQPPLYDRTTAHSPAQPQGVSVPRARAVQFFHAFLPLCAASLGLSPPTPRPKTTRTVEKHAQKRR